MVNFVLEDFLKYFGMVAGAGAGVLLVLLAAIVNSFTSSNEDEE